MESNDCRVLIEEQTIILNFNTMLMGLFLHMVYISRLTPPPYIEMPMTSQQCDLSCICVLMVSVLTLSMNFLLGFGIVTTLWYFLFFISSYGKHLQ